MKKLFALSLITILLGCSSEKFQCKWMVIISSDNPMSAYQVRAEKTKSGSPYVYQSGSYSNMSFLNHEFKASKANTIEVSTESFGTGSLTIQIFKKDELVKEQTFNGTGQGDSFSMIFSTNP